MTIEDMMLSAIFAALMCIFAVITIPIGTVPISMAVFGIVLTACVLGHKRAATAVAVYILLGIIGLPVFSGFRGGFSAVIGPTGGYIISYIPTAIFIGFFTNKLPRKKTAAVARLAAISFGGVLISYVLGTLQFSIVTGTPFVQSLAVCVVPFVMFDIAKCIVGAALAYAVRRTLKKTKKNR